MQKETSKKAEKPKSPEIKLQKPLIIPAPQKTTQSTRNQLQQVKQATNTVQSGTVKPKTPNQLIVNQKNQVTANSKQVLTQDKNDLKKNITTVAQSNEAQSIQAKQSPSNKPVESNIQKKTDLKSDSQNKKIDSVQENVMKKSDQQSVNEKNEYQIQQNQTNQANNQSQKNIVESELPQNQKAQQIQGNQVLQNKAADINDFNKGNQKLSGASVQSKKDDQAVSFINKNTIQIILPFLKPNEIIKLCLLSKGMYQLIQNYFQNILEKLHEERKQLLLEHQISEEQAKAVMYLEHYNVFNHQHQGIIASCFFSEEHLKELIFALWQTVASKGSRGDIYINSSNPQNMPRHFHAGHNIYNASSDKLHIIGDCLKKYTDEFVENTKFKDDYFRNDMILLQKYLKGIKLFIELNFNEDTLYSIQSIYLEKILKIDRQIYSYQKISKQKTEQLEVFTFDLDQPYKEMKIKDIPRRLFD